MSAARNFDDGELDALADELNRDGICILKGALDRDLVARWAASFERIVHERRDRPGGLAPRGPGRFYVTLPWQAPFDDPSVFANPAVRGVLDRVLAQEYVMVQLGADTPIRGSDYQVTHRDYRPLFSDEVLTPLYAVAVNFPLCDVNEENGPLEMVRGTHRMARDEALGKLARGELELDAFPMQMGDVSIRTPLALHRGTPNRTDHMRPMIVTGYVMHWLHTPKVDLTLPRAAYEALPEAHRKLLRCVVVESLPEAPVETYIEFAY